MIGNIKLKLAKQLRMLRRRFGYSQEVLAERAGLDYKHIQRLESKTPNAARIDTLEKLAKSFNLTCSELLKFKD